MTTRRRRRRWSRHNEERRKGTSDEPATEAAHNTHYHNSCSVQGSRGPGCLPGQKTITFAPQNPKTKSESKSGDALAAASQCEADEPPRRQRRNRRPTNFEASPRRPTAAPRLKGRHPSTKGSYISTRYYEFQQCIENGGARVGLALARKSSIQGKE